MYIVYGKENCPNCTAAKNVLNAKDIEYKYVTFGTDDMTKETLEKLAKVGVRSVPQILHIGNDGGFFRYVGGLKELMEDIKNA